ncbi:MAG: UDP-N-acetylmuramoyl-L-alanyl-D-glutamate--2,6-diaminopimelate ligase [Thermodesulfovibrionales bacterium]|nr:UDP-N-acetylmuramoyl-L-alanyl-D-glutamate--2,6-diaminopimelate ligase [Thermodesulfovibrionales bacterium]
MTKKLLEVVDKDFQIIGSVEVPIQDIVFDSRQVTPHSLFVALRGVNTDGHDYIEQAILNGASAVVCENRKELIEEINKKYPYITIAIVEDTAKAMAHISSVFFDIPSKHMTVIGITGTNGKTTTSYIIKSIIERLQCKSGLIGTIQYMIDKETFQSPHTTPESPIFQSLLKKMLDSGCDYVITEVSSHALSQKRADNTEFNIAIFTNLTRDHLDYHKDIEDYFDAKARLFTDLLIENGIAIINIDDIYGLKLIERLKNRSVKIITYGIYSNEAYIKASDININYSGSSYNLVVNNQILTDIKSPLCGMTNVYNTLSAIATALALNISIEKIKEGIAMTTLVKGRFEKVDLGQDFLAVVDYAHTEDALERLLLTARQLLNAFRVAKDTESLMKAKKQSYISKDESMTKGKIITVFGCGGNRDKGKRSKMGEIASRLGDFVIVTSDNPRNEDPKEIIREIERGIKNDNYIVIPDRKVAISLAVELASTGDIVLVAGKGHEEYQEVGKTKKLFSDKKTLEEAIRKTISRPSFADWAGYFNTKRSLQNAHC